MYNMDLQLILKQENMLAIHHLTITYKQVISVYRYPLVNIIYTQQHCRIQFN